VALRAKFDQFLPHLDERRRRLYLASEAIALGHGGITMVATASGFSAATIARGIAELSGRPLPAGRIRAPGAGRKPVTVTDPGLLPALEALIEPHTRGDPVSPLRWTTLSLQSLASALTTRGHPVSAATVGRLLHALGYSLQGTAKTTEGTSHPDRDAQFSHINATAAAFLEDNQPVISVDTKAKEWLGNRDRPGRTWRPGKTPIRVDCHTFITGDQPVVIPYGIYDIARNTGWVNVGTDHDTAEFAVASIRRWWQQRGHDDHPDAARLLITADCGGSNDPRRWTWKKHLAALRFSRGNFRWPRFCGCGSENLVKGWSYRRVAFARDWWGKGMRVFRRHGGVAGLVMLLTVASLTSCTDSDGSGNAQAMQEALRPIRDASSYRMVGEFSLPDGTKTKFDARVDSSGACKGVVGDAESLLVGRRVWTRWDDAALLDAMRVLKGDRVASVDPQASVNASHPVVCG
jgi:hypothetical protein